MKAIILKYDEERHDYIVEDLDDDRHMVIKESQLQNLKARLGKVRKQRTTICCWSLADKSYRTWTRSSCSRMSRNLNNSDECRPFCPSHWAGGALPFLIPCNQHHHAHTPSISEILLSSMTPSETMPDGYRYCATQGKLFWASRTYMTQDLELVSHRVIFAPWSPSFYRLPNEMSIYINAPRW